MQLESFIRTIPDYPKKGIQFKDITPLLNNREAFQDAIEQFANKLAPYHFEALVGIESRGFIFGAALAFKMNKRFIPVRKRNKLPHDVFTMEYELEYGTDILEIHKDALQTNDSVVIIDDLLATGGTVGAVEKLVKLAGGQIAAVSFLIELGFLKGREKINCPAIISLIEVA